MNNALRVSKVPDDMKFYAIGTYLRDSALQDYTTYQRTTYERDRNIKDFFELLLTSENNRAKKERVNLDLRKLRQTGEFEEYLTEFKRLAKDSRIPEPDLISFFIDGLRGAANWDIQMKEPKTLAEAYSFARKYFQSDKYKMEMMTHKAFYAQCKVKTYKNPGEVEIIIITKDIRITSLVVVGIQLLEVDFRRDLRFI